MKNAAHYEKRLKKFLANMPKGRSAGKELPLIELLIISVFEENSTRKAGLHALESIRAEYADWNELRVSQPKEIIETIGKDTPQGREKAESLVKAMDAVFEKSYDLTLETLGKMPKRDLRRYMLDLGLSPYVSAAMMLQAFGGHAIPVDRDLAYALEIEDVVHPDSTIEEIQGFLERIISQKDARAAHDFFRQHVEKSSKSIAKLRKSKEAAAAPPKVEVVEAPPEPQAKPPVEAKAESQSAPAKPKAKKAVNSQAKAGKRPAKSKKAKKTGKKGKA